MGKRQYSDDDGRQIADLSGLEPSRLGWNKGAAEGEDRSKPRDTALSTLDAKETRGVVFGALTAGLLVGAIFIAGAAAVIGICLLIWS